MSDTLPPPLPDPAPPGFPPLVEITGKALNIVTVMAGNTNYNFDQLASLFRIAATQCDEMWRFQKQITGGQKK